MTGEEPRKRALIWHLELLPPSETFIRNQVDSFSRWQPLLVGSVRRPSALSRDSDRFVFPNSRVGRIRAKLFHRTGRSRAVRRFVREVDPDLIHAHFARDGWIIAQTARSVGVPLVVTLHGHDITRWPAQRGARGLVARYRLRRLFATATTIVAVSDFIRGEAIRWGADPSKVVTRYIGVPSPIELPPNPEVKWDVVFVGRLVEKKGAEDLLLALSQADQAVPSNLRVAVIGDGPLRGSLERVAARYRLKVDFLGTQRPAEVSAALSSARVFAAPSKYAADGDAEGFGMVFLEAAAARIPAVAYAHGGVTEAVSDGITGLLAPEGDIAALASNIVTLLSDEESRVALGEEGRRRTQTDFNVRTCTAELERTFDAAVHDGSAS
ncbi:MULTISPECIES: glycosyltransferase [Microbacterium]|uniref:Glycosyltransferase involved in cell wall bisynthesis n=1 Tax=Microbacterium saccharophilum TaxID=1213358 RepID=A0A7Z7D1P2_9MICO|nr:MULTISPECIES: glycosyltransferase [Microbacterium]SFI75722.1 Glycosyltransferase involved in cell wall bisynthesis [Microbacterium saccharophilum]